MSEKGVAERIIDGLLRNMPLVLVVLGAFFVLFGANGSFEKIWLNHVQDSYWRVFLAALGTVVGGFGVRLIWRGQGAADTSAFAKECELKITSPRNHLEVDEKIELGGTYKKRPPRKTLVVAIEQTPDGQYWFKKQETQFNEKDKLWSTDIYIGGNRGEERTLYLTILGEAGETLRDYFLAVRTKLGKSVGVGALTPDIAICDQVTVYRTKAGISIPPKEGEEYGLKIQSPRNNAPVGHQIHVEGTYQQRVPADRRVALLEYVPSIQQYWFKAETPTFVERDKRWFADVWSGGVSGEERILQVVILGQCGQALMDYYLAVAQKTWERGQKNASKKGYKEDDEYVGVKALTPDIVRCDEVTVTFRE